MSLPTPTDLAKLDIAFQGQPFVCVPAKSTVTLAGMDVAFQAQPFVVNEAVGGASAVAKELIIKYNIIALATKTLIVKYNI